MNENNEKLTPIQIAEKQERIKQKYQEDLKEKDQTILDLQNKLTDKDNEIFGLQKEIDRTQQDRDDWKKEAHRNRRIEQDNKHTKAQNDFKSEFIRLQETKRGWKWDEAKGWVN